MQKYDKKTMGIRCLSGFLMAFSLMFGITWSKHGLCFGDNILTSLGLPAWSQGTTGTHYSAIFAVVIFLGAFFLFASTAKKEAKHD